MFAVFPRLMVLLTLLTSFHFSNAAIYEIRQIKEIGKVVDNGTLLVFDLDNTLIRPTQTLGSDQWFGYVVKTFLNSGLSETEATSKAILVWSQIQLATPVLPVEPDTARVVRLAQGHKLKVMGLTARPPNLSSRTHVQLMSIGVDFRKSPVFGANTAVQPDGSMYANGILYVGASNDKGTVLRRFLGGMGYRPHRIVFIDDKAKHVQNVEAAFKNEGIEYFGLRYGATDAWVGSFNPDIANVEFKIFREQRRLITDAQACQLIPGKCTR